MNFEVRKLEVHEASGWKMTSKNKSWIDSNLKKSFMGESISSKLSGQLRMLLKNNHSKFECCTIPLWLPRPLSSYSTNNYETSCSCSILLIVRLLRGKNQTPFLKVQKVVWMPWNPMTIRRNFYCHIPLEKCSFAS